jgi:hypothetical protein
MNSSQGHGKGQRLIACSLYNWAEKIDVLALPLIVERNAFGPAT